MEIILTGNPNSGKTSLFNQLTGLNQRVGNYPGITVDKRVGSFTYKKQLFQIFDLPGIYSLYAGSEDEKIAVNAILDYRKSSEKPLAICMVDINTPHKNLLLLSQIVDLGLPVIGVLNCRKKSTPSEVANWIKALEEKFKTTFVAVNASTGAGLNNLKIQIEKQFESRVTTINYSVETNDYNDWITLANREISKDSALRITQDLRERLENIDSSFSLKDQKNDIANTSENSNQKSSKLDAILMHPIWGYFIFGVALLVIFQAIFSWSAYPMDIIEFGFGALSEFNYVHRISRPRWTTWKTP